MKRLNITLPDEVSSELNKIPNKSRFIAEAVQEKLRRMRRKKLDELLIEGYKYSYKEGQNTNKEWEAATLENWPDYE